MVIIYCPKTSHPYTNKYKKIIEDEVGMAVPKKYTNTINFVGIKHQIHYTSLRLRMHCAYWCNIIQLGLKLKLLLNQVSIQIQLSAINNNYRISSIRCRTQIVTAFSIQSPLTTSLNGIHVLVSGAAVYKKAIKKLLTKADGDKQLGIELRTSLFVILVCSNTTMCCKQRLTQYD